MRSTRRAAASREYGCPPAATLPALIDKWLHEPAIRRTGLVVVLASLTAVVTIAVVAGPSGIALLMAIGLSASLRRAGRVKPEQIRDES